MNEHAGPACALSVLIVGVFAVLLHEKIPANAPPSHQAIPTTRADVEAPPGPPAQPQARPSPVPESSSPPPRVSIASKSPPQANRPAPEPPRPQPPPKVVTRPALPDPPVAAPMKADGRPRRAASAFTEVESGETLGDVARRVYGTSEMAESLWRANRDLLDRPASALARGMLLRTP